MVQCGDIVQMCKHPFPFSFRKYYRQFKKKKKIWFGSYLCDPVDI